MFRKLVSKFRRKPAVEVYSYSTPSTHYLYSPTFRRLVVTIRKSGYSTYLDWRDVRFKSLANMTVRGHEVQKLYGKNATINSHGHKVK